MSENINETKRVTLNSRETEIPADWEVDYIGDVAEKTKGTKPDTLYEKPGSDRLPYLTISASEGEVGSWANPNDGKQVTNGQTLMVWDGASCGTVFKSPQGIIGSTLAAFKFDGSKFESEFAYYFLNHLQGRISELGEGTGIPHVPSDFTKIFQVLQPPLSEQRRIADILSTIDEQIGQTQEIIDVIDDLKEGFIQDMLTKGASNRETSMVKVPMIPKMWELPTHWDLQFLEDVCEFITDGTHQTPDYVEEGIPFLRVENITDGKINWEDLVYISKEEYEEIVSSKKPHKGDVLLSKNGTIGRTKVVDWEREFGYYVSLCLIRPDREEIDSRYLAEVLSSEICLQQAKIRSKKATVTNLHLEEIRQFSIPIPPIETQSRIADIIDKINEMKSIETHRLRKLKGLKRGVMQDLLTGKVRVNSDN